MTDALPLAGVRVLELAGLAPGPFAGMVLADFGADVVRVDKNGTSFNPDVLARGKRSISLSLKSPSGVALLKTLLSPSPSCSNVKCGCSTAKLTRCARNTNKGLWRADVLIDPFRPGVLERLGLGPDVLMKLNPRLIIARLTGYRREGPYSTMAGHDINYAALSGVLSMLGRKGERPAFPVNLLADFGGGGLMAVVGIMMALFERERSGKGQVVETDMVTGARYLSTFPLVMARPSVGLPIWDQPRGENILDGGAPWYEAYETKDGEYMTVGAIESPFYATFLKTLLGALPASAIPSPAPTPQDQLNKALWPTLATFLTQSFLSKTRDEWSAIFLSTDSCVAPVLNRHEVDSRGLGPGEPGLSLSGGDEEIGEGGIPCAAPKLVRTPARRVEEAYEGDRGVFLEPGRDTMSFLGEAGIARDVAEGWLKEGVVESSEEEVKAKL